MHTRPTPLGTGGLLAVLAEAHRRVGAVAAAHDLTSQQLALLRRLAAPISMGAVAQELSCDPSNVTGLIDRVERLGPVERRPDPADRRVRLLALTAKGRRVRQRLAKELMAEVSQGWALSNVELENLLSVVHRDLPISSGCREAPPKGLPGPGTGRRRRPPVSPVGPE